MPAPLRIADVLWPWPPGGRIWTGSGQGPRNIDELILDGCEFSNGAMRLEAHEGTHRYSCAVVPDADIEPVLARLRASEGLSLVEVGRLEL